MMHSPREPVRFSKLVTRSLLILLVAFFLMSGPPSSDAADLSYDPLWVDFGSVTIGDTAYLTLTLTNEDTAEAIIVDSIVFTFNQGGSFTWSTDEPLPAGILPGESMVIDLSFTAMDESFAGADMWIYSNADNYPSLYVNLMGEGSGGGDPCSPLTNCDGFCVDIQTDVEHCGQCYNACPTDDNGVTSCNSGICEIICNDGYEWYDLTGSCVPEGSYPTALEMLQELIAFVRQARIDGTLEGLGPDWNAGKGAYASADKRFDAFVHMLARAGNLLLDERIDEVCGQLNSAQLRCDGGWPIIPPTDFVAGEDRPIVYQSILDIMQAIAEEYPDASCEPNIIEP